MPILGDIPILGELLFTHNSDVEREQNVVIYLTPYIVRKSADLQKLKRMLAELEEVQGRYNSLFEKALEEKKSNSLFPSTSDSSTRNLLFSSVESNAEPVSLPSPNVNRSKGKSSNLDLLNPMEEF